MTRRLHNITMRLILALLVLGIVQRASAMPSEASAAQAPYAPQAASQAVPAAGTAPQQAISQSGLLPLFAVDMNIDASWIDGDAVPSASPQFSHNGVNDVLDQAWTTLRAAGFNAIRFPVHLEDPKAAVRVANLCIWANSNGARLIPVLQGNDALRKDISRMSAALGTFVTTLITQLRGSASPVLASYAQISFFQLERPMNHAGLYPGMKTASAQKLLIAGSAALRQAETLALQGTGIQGTPISIGASYDFELIRAGAIAGVPLDPAAEQKAQNSLKEFLNGFNSPGIEAINIEWFPRSVSAGDVDHFVTLLQFFKQAFPDKEVTLTSGFSTAFNPADQALQFYAAAISNLGALRASDGLDSKFVGVVFQQAFRGANADSQPPAGTTDPSQWKWPDRAQQLGAMWSRGTPSADMSWWVGKVQDNMGFIALSPDPTTATSLAPLPSLQVLQEIASTMGQATQQVQTATTIAPSSTITSPGVVTAAGGFVTTPASGYVPGAQPSTQSASSPVQQMLFALLQQFTQQMTTSLMAKFAGSNPQNAYVNPAGTGVTSTPSGTIAATTPSATVAPPGTSPVANTVWIGPTDVVVSASSAAAGQSVVVTAQVHNQSPDQDIAGVTLELVNPANPSASNPPIQSGITVPHSGVTPVQLAWTPDATASGDVHLLLQALDSGGQIVTTVAVPQITVQSSSGQAKSGNVGNVETAAPGAPVNSFANTGSTTNTNSPTNSGSTTSTASTPGPSSLAPSTAQLTVAAFGFADPNSSPAGQVPELQAQISNPSQLPTQSGQAQLFFDGKPQQMQTISSVLPSGTLILRFTPIQAAVGQHNLQLVLTTTDGVNTTATLATNVAAGGTGTVSRVRPVGPRGLRPSFRTVNNLPATTSGTTATTSTTPAAATGTTGTQQSFAPSASSGPTNPGVDSRRRSARSGSGISAQPSGATVTPTATAPANTDAQNTPTPANAGDTTPTGSVAVATTPQRAVVRTITPSSSRAMTGAVGLQTTAPLQPQAVRTITPGAGIRASTTATRTVISANSDSPAAVRTATSGVRTLTPGTATAIRGTATPASVTAKPGTSTAAVTPTRTISALRPNPAGIPSTNNSVAMARGSADSSTANPAAFVDLGISTQDVHVVPMSPQAGQIATFTAVIRNNGTLPAQGATAVFSLIANGQRVATSQSTMFNVSPHGAFQARWAVGVPAVANAQLMVSVAVNGDSNPANNQSLVSFAVVANPAKAPLKHR